MFSSIKSLFCLPDPLAVATKELRMAQLELLQAQGSLEAAKGHVSVLAERVKRLQQTIESYSKPDSAA